MIFMHPVRDQQMIAQTINMVIPLNVFLDLLDYYQQKGSTEGYSALLLLAEKIGYDISEVRDRAGRVMQPITQCEGKFVLVPV